MLLTFNDDERGVYPQNLLNFRNKLYGSTVSSLFTLNTDGSNFTKLFDFNGTNGS